MSPPLPPLTLVLVDEHPETLNLLRLARQRARETGGVWMALYVATPRRRRWLSEAAYEEILKWLTLARQTGGDAMQVEAPSIEQGVRDIYHQYRTAGMPADMLIVGETPGSRVVSRVYPGVVQRLRGLALENLVIQAVPFARHTPPRLRTRQRWWFPDVDALELLLALCAVGAAYGVTETIRYFLQPTIFLTSDENISLIFMIACAFTAGRYGLLPGLVASVASAFTINYFYTAPFYVLMVDTANKALHLSLFLLSSLVISLFASRTLAQAEATKRREYRTNLLFRLQRVASQAGDRAGVLHALRNELEKLLELPVAFFMPTALSPDRIEPACPDDVPLADADVRALQVCWQEMKTTGVGSPYNPGTTWRFKPLLTVQGEIGVLGIRLHAHNRSVDLEQGRLMIELSDQVAAILERTEMNQTLEQSRIHDEREKLRSMLLSSVSHDLKTPLASVIGSLSIYRSMGAQLPQKERGTLIDTALQEAQRLDSFITNILDMTRLETGSIDFKSEWTNPNQPLNRLKKRMHDRLSAHVCTFHTCSDAVEVCMDSVMVEQVLQNVLDNAVKYTPPGTVIEAGCCTEQKEFVYTIRDHGQGIPPDKLTQIFDKYARLRKVDSQVAGTGLGLAISKAIMEAQGGSITAANHPEGGAIFTLRLPKWRKLMIPVGSA